MNLRTHVAFRGWAVHFAVHSQGVVVELDGRIHADPEQQVAGRNRDDGRQVIRFENAMVFSAEPRVVGAGNE